MTAPNARVDKQAEVLRGLAIDITRALEHVQRELAATDWHPADTMNGGSGKGGVSDPTGRVATARSELTGRREDIRDWIDGLEQFTRSGRFIVSQTLGLRSVTRGELFDAGSYDVSTCRYKWPDPRDESVTLTCTNWASGHVLPGGTIEVTDWCDDHWVLMCQVHGTHPHDGRRADGVLCCQKAYREHKRETEAMA